MADNTGIEERGFILSTANGVGGFAGGRVYRTQVPDSVTLPRNDDGTVRPYIVARFQTPFASSAGRSIAAGEARQPHVMTFMLTAYAGSAEHAEILNAAIVRKIVGAIPSPTASQIKAVAGHSFTVADTANRPARFAEGSRFRVEINLEL